MEPRFLKWEGRQRAVIVACWGLGALIANVVVWFWMGRPAASAYLAFVLQANVWFLVFGMFGMTFGMMLYFVWWTFPRRAR